ncbi:S41 family peptidase [Telluribacter sp. SYSU D00476]|uniref:S41 family peptidase n=1 Tax=Telluribacter sp. SYSU D00476 TaxID=2811430 RepID=UPI001FF684A0|nr:S41 family peptidase [Telluribacter sp. SYSU D00476]
MKTLVKLYLLLMHCLTLPSCMGQTTEPPALIQTQYLKEDLRLFRTALEEAHPGLYTHSSKARMDSAFNQVSQSITRPLSQQEFYKLLTPVVTMIGCGHVKFMVKNKEDIKFPFHQNKLFPVKLYFSKNGVFAWKSYTGDDVIPAGAEIISINKKPIQEVVDQLMAYNSFADGATETGKYLELNNYFSGYYSTFIEETDSYVVEYKNAAGNRESTKVDGVPYTVVNESIKKDLKHLQENQLALKFLKNGTALLTLKTFWFESKESSFEKFLEESFREINKRGVSSLIIDIRNNEGGKDSYGSLLYSYLTDKPYEYYTKVTTNTNKKFSFSEHAYTPWFFGIYRQVLSKKDGEYHWKYHSNLKRQKPQKDNYKGKVYILTNGHSFSVTSEFASIAHHHKRATFIGEETGGGYTTNNSGFFAIVDLPHSNLVLGIPLWKYHQAVNNPARQHRGVVPDHEVVPTIADLLAGKDPVLETALQLTNQAPVKISSNH